MAGIDTGVGGFEIDGVVHDFNTGDPNDTTVGVPGVKPGSGDIKVDHSKKDISKGTRVTLGNYLKKTTLEKNVIPVPGAPTDVALNDEKGTPSAMSQPISGQFAEKVTTVVLKNDPSTLLTGLSKGKHGTAVDTTVDGPKDGNTLLPSVTAKTQPKVVSSYTSAVLSNNRFSATNKMVADTGPDAAYNPKLRHPKYGELSMGQMAQVGVALSLRASQEQSAGERGNNPTGGGQEAAAILPSPNQFGTGKINALVLKASDVLDGLTKEEVPSGMYSSISNDSWGALNNIDDPFTGVSSLGMVALSMAMTASVTLLFEGIGFLISLIKGGSTGAARNVSGRYVLGRHSVVKNTNPSAFPPGIPPDISALLGIRTTTFPLGTAIKKGVAIFFGVDDTGGLLGAITSGAKNAAQNPGYNVVTARAIVRSSIVIAEQFKKVFSSSNFISGVKNILGIVEVLRSSKLIAAINVFAAIGDQALTDPGNVATDGMQEEPVKKSRIDSEPDEGPAASFRKNRLRGSIKLAWSSNRAPSMYLIPDSVLTMAAADNQLGAFKGPVGIDNKKLELVTISKADSNQKGSRITADKVKWFESTLDAEYVPFSFQDLRTNEFVSFHAFLAGMNDDYTASYEKTDAYGRVDPVNVYKNTVRRIGMSFYIIATSEQDFDEMWIKINKLTTLVYPQYTRGHMLVNKEKGLQFVQPFSQLIGAAPMVRLRLGDLIRSNYSRFALARLFGLGGTDTVNLGDKSKDINASFTGGSKLLETFKQQSKNLIFDPTAVFTLGSDGWSKSLDGGFSLPLPLGGGSDAPTQAPTLRIDLQDAPYVTLKIKPAKSSEISCECEVKLMTASDITDEYGTEPSTAQAIAASLKARYENGGINMKIVGPRPYVVPAAALKATNGTLRKLYSKVFATQQADIETISQFLDPEKNALVKSFSDVQGKGLAGFIESMNFDWYDNVTWETSQGKVAPKMCKVTITYSPIHDISPGIDHLGYNRAPIYPVGSAMGGMIDKAKGK